MKDNQDIKDKIKLCKMKLLYNQTRILHEEFNKKDNFGNNILLYIVDKRWLDDSKKKNGYDKIVTELKDTEGNNDKTTIKLKDTGGFSDNYKAVKEKLLKEINIDENVLKTKGAEDLIENSYYINKQEEKKYNLKVPKNIELVYYTFILDYFGDSYEKNSKQPFLKFYGGYLGDQTIIMRGKEGDICFIYCCSLIPDKNNEYSFAVKVDYILIFNDEETRDEQIKRIGELGGLNNYLKDLKIDVNKEIEKETKDEDGNTIKFLKFIENNNNDISNQENNVINIISKKKKINNKITNTNSIKKILILFI